MIAGRYELEREVGRGGMGAVWLARDTTLGREVAVKRIGMAPGGSTPDQERAAREARLAARLNHAHVVQVFDLVSDDDVQWLVMEYVDGLTLASLIHSEGALDPRRASELVGQAADALAAAHAAGIVHRDVKPSNILVGPQGQVKLSDFGIAKAEADPSLTQTGLVTGSPAYLSPEVASGQLASTASDVWSLGATLYHALSGRPPYEVGDNLMGALFRIVHEEPPRLPEAGWPAPLLDVTMTRDPADRWTMEQVRDYLVAGPEGTPAPGAPDATQVMTPPVLPPPAPAAAAAPASARPVDTPPEGSAVAARAERRRVGMLPLALGAALVVLLGLLAWALLAGDDEGSTPTIDRPGSTERSTASDSSSPNRDRSRSPDAGPTAAGMESFIDNYLATAPESPETTFQMLTPAFQRASGGMDGYSGYWSTIRTADLVDVQADPESLSVQYTVAYVREDGSEVTDDVQLQLEYRDGNYLIAQEA